MGNIAIDFALMREHLQAGNLPKSQDEILQFLEEVTCGVCNDMVVQGFFHIVVQLEMPEICSVVAVSLWIGTVAGLMGTKNFMVSVVEVYLAAVITRARCPWILPPSGVKTDTAFLFGLAQAGLGAL